METGPAVFAGVSFAVFGIALVLWTCVRMRTRQPVAAGVPQLTAATLAGLFGVISLMTGIWVLLLS